MFFSQAHVSLMHVPVFCFPKAVEGGSSAKLQRAMSCDSVCSDTSVVLDTLESPQNNGELEVALEYSRWDSFS